MRGVFFVCCLMLALSTSFESCKAQKVPSTTVSDLQSTTESWKENDKSASTYLKSLSAALSNFTENFEKIKARQNLSLLNAINNNANYISIKARLDKKFPDFWKVPKRFLCTQVLDILVDRYVSGHHDKEFYNNQTITEVGDILGRMKNYLDSASDALLRREHDNLENCQENEKYCKMVNEEVEKFEKEIEPVKNKLSQLSTYESYYTYYIDVEINNMIRGSCDDLHDKKKKN